MKRSALAVLVLCACHKHEGAATRVDPTPTAPAATSATLVESPAPSETASAAPSASAAPMDPREARAAALEQARSVGMIGLLGSSDDSGVPWGREDSLGAKGNMWGDQIGDSFGAGGLGLSGVGSRDGGPGGGTGEGIGLGNIGTIGHGAGTGTGQGFGSGQGRLGTGRSYAAPRIRQGTTTVNGRLPPELIQRIVRQNFGRFRLCYEQGLRSNPKLSGTAATKFVIDKTGAVSSASRDGSTTLSDGTVVDCIVRGFGNLSFPQPEGGGIVIVIYPLILEPPDSP